MRYLRATIRKPTHKDLLVKILYINFRKFSVFQVKLALDRFFAKNTDAFTIRDEFLSFVSQKKHLGAIFITEHGKETEGILGIITAWDLPKIKGLLK